MNFAELVQEVYTITGRPDRVAETSSAIRAATLKAHQSDFYYKDIFETGLDFGAAAYVQNLDYRLLLPRWRAVKYIRKVDITTTPVTPGKFLDLIPPELILDRYVIQKVDIFYVAGAYVQINSSTQEQYYILGCYLNPDVTEATYTSWIAQDHPWAIIYDAAASVEIALGKLEEAKGHRGLFEEQISLLKSSNIQPEGF